jgi:hypothetical protein
MASSNTLTYVIPQILAQGLVALRENAIMARLVNRGYSPTPGEKGSTVDVPIPSAITANPVVPEAYPQAATNLSPSKVSISLDQWYEAAFTLSDKEVTQAMDGLVPMQVTEAAKALANNVDAYILGKYKGIYGFAGTAATTPFGSDLSAAINARRELQRNLAPMAPRYIVLDEDAEAKALALDTILEADKAGSRETYVSGMIGRLLGADWHMDQNVPTHTSGTLVNGAGTKIALITTQVAAGGTTMAVDHTTLTGTIVEGDVFAVTGVEGTYVVTNTSPVTASGNAATGITFLPAARAAFPNNATVTFQAGHVVNLFFHRDAFALATRPLEDTVAQGMGSLVMADVDPISGLTLRLEVNRQHKQTRWSFDILYGAQLVRAALAARILG